jgi:hypothetical protein
MGLQTNPEKLMENTKVQRFIIWSWMNHEKKSLG